MVDLKNIRTEKIREDIKKKSGNRMDLITSLDLQIKKKQREVITSHTNYVQAKIVLEKEFNDPDFRKNAATELNIKEIKIPQRQPRGEVVKEEGIYPRGVDVKDPNAIDTYLRELVNRYKQFKEEYFIRKAERKKALESLDVTKAEKKINVTEDDSKEIRKLTSQLYPLETRLPLELDSIIAILEKSRKNLLRIIQSNKTSESESYLNTIVKYLNDKVTKVEATNKTEKDYSELLLAFLYRLLGQPIKRLKEEERLTGRDKKPRIGFLKSLFKRENKKETEELQKLIDTNGRELLDKQKRLEEKMAYLQDRITRDTEIYATFDGPIISIIKNIQNHFTRIREQTEFAEHAGNLKLIDTTIALARKKLEDGKAEEANKMLLQIGDIVNKTKANLAAIEGEINKIESEIIEKERIEIEELNRFKKEIKDQVPFSLINNISTEVRGLKAGIVTKANEARKTDSKLADKIAKLSSSLIDVEEILNEINERVSDLDYTTEKTIDSVRRKDRIHVGESISRLIETKELLLEKVKMVTNKKFVIEIVSGVKEDLNQLIKTISTKKKQIIKKKKNEPHPERKLGTRKGANRGKNSKR